jgi:hypothetical protein
VEEAAVLSRRDLLRGASVATVTVGAAVSGLLPVELEAVAKPVTKKVWHLSPWYPCKRRHSGESGEDVEAIKKRRGCQACRACRAHARNKFFATARAARKNRAHIGCHCVAYSTVVLRHRYRRLFGFPGCAGQGRTVFDKRVHTLYKACKKA